VLNLLHQAPMIPHLEVLSDDKLNKCENCIV